jgi:menaquinone-specific isochorismate synthase
MIRNLKEDRGWYGGPIGWIDNNLDGQFYLNIRSGLGLNKDLYLFSGSGITEKSNTENEWNETEHKFKSMLESL